MINNQWYAIIPSKAVRKNKIVAVRRLNLDLALFRYANGDLGCVIDQCSHRGASLAKGELVGECIKCPFHGLEFDKLGKCKFIPANGRASKEDFSRYNIKHFPTKEVYGIIYLWYGDADEVMATPPFFYQDIDSTYVYSEISDLWNSHYSRCIENQLDVVHLPFVHRNTIGKGNKTLVNGPKIEYENGVLRTSANNEVDHGQRPKSPGECVIRDTNLNFIFPNIWMNQISQKVKVLIYFAPVDNENTILYIRFYCKLTRSKLINRIVAFFGKFANRVIERQDKRVVITQKPKASSLRAGEKLLSGDLPILQYRIIREELKNI